MDTLIGLMTTTEGRIGRRQWWLGIVVLIVASIVLSLILGILGLGNWAQLVAYFVLLYPNWCLGIKRRQDRDNNGLDFKILIVVSGLTTLLQAFGIGVTMMDMGNGVLVPMPDMWLSVIYFATAALALYLLIQLGFLRGTAGPNSYGPDPLDRA
jgi:uncharacterized membrane protein YhaH (DUF805 family)